MVKILNKPVYSEMVEAKVTKLEGLWRKLHHMRVTCNLEGVSQNYLTMKVKGNGQGKVLSQDELKRLFTEGFSSARDRALFGICLFTGCRVSEALALQTTDLIGGMLIFRKSTTKGKLKTRVVDIQPGLAQLLEAHQPSPGFLFPGGRPGAALTRFMTDKLLKRACNRTELVDWVSWSQHPQL